MDVVRIGFLCIRKTFQLGRESLRNTHERCPYLSDSFLLHFGSFFFLLFLLLFLLSLLVFSSISVCVSPNVCVLLNHTQSLNKQFITEMSNTLNHQLKHTQDPSSALNMLQFSSVFDLNNANAATIVLTLSLREYII